MTSIVNISNYKATRIRSISRIINLGVAVGLPVMLIQFQPVKIAWIATGVLLSIVLGIFAIVGLWPKLRISVLGHVLNNKVVDTTVFLLVGLGVIVAVVYNPPVSAAWYAFFSLVGALMVFDAIFSMSYTLAKKKVRKAADIHHHDKVKAA